MYSMFYIIIIKSIVVGDLQKSFIYNVVHSAAYHFDSVREVNMSLENLG